MAQHFTEFLAKVEQCWGKWVTKGVVSGTPPEVIRSNAIPPVCFNDLRSLYLKPIQRVVRKANRQIRETKQAFNLPDYKGLLLIANDGNFAIPPDSLLRLILQAMHGLPCPDVRECVLFSVNILAHVPDSHLPSHIWLSGALEGEAIPANIILDICEKWKTHHEKITGRQFRPLGYFDTQKISL